MKLTVNDRLYKQCKAKGLSLNHVCEVGVYLPQTSNVLGFILENIKTTLVEPDPKNVKAIREFFKDRDNISLFPFAVFDFNGIIELVQREASTFVSSLKASPAIINDNYHKKESDIFEVECKTFDTIDDGSIDLLSVDTEGCEWYVLKNIKSRPKVISIETHGHFYINPSITEITDWLQANHYVIWYKDNTDSIYIKEDLFAITPGERAILRFKMFLLKIERFKHRIKKIFKG